MRNLMKMLPLLFAMLMAVPLTATAHGDLFIKPHFDGSIERTNVSRELDPRRHRTDHYHYRFQSTFDARLDRQWRRIEQGMRSGELTRKEAKRLKKRHRKLAKLQRVFLDDGRLSRKERRELTDRLDAASNRIYRLKHNDHRRVESSCYHDYDHDHSARKSRVSGLHHLEHSEF